MKNDKLALLALVSVTFIWGFDYIAVDYVSGFFSETVMTLVRTGVAAILATGLALVKDKGIHIEKKDWPRTILCGVFGMGIYLLMETYGIAHTSGSLASLIMATMPVMGLLADFVICKNKITPKNLIGILGSVAGVVCMIISTGESLTGSVMGIVILLIAAAIWVLYIVYSKPLYEKYSLTTVLSGVFTSGALITVPLLFIIDRPIRVTTQPLPIIVLVLTALVAIFGAELLYSFAIRKSSVTIVSLSENIMPLVTVIFSWIIFGKMLTPLEIIGGVIIIASVMLITMVKDKGENN